MCVCVCVCVCVHAHACMLPLSRFSGRRLFATLWTVVSQAPLFMGLSRQKCRRGCLAPLQGTSPTQGSSLYLLSSPVLAGGFFTTSAAWETPWSKYVGAEVSFLFCRFSWHLMEPVDSSHTNAF